MMTPDRAILFADYISCLSKGNIGSTALRARIRALTIFCNKASELNRRGYRKFFKEHSSELVENGINSARTVIADFLAYIGHGFKSGENRKVPTKQYNYEVGRISQRNMELISHFLSSLTEHRDYSDNTIRIYKDSCTQFFSYFDDLNNTTARAYIDILIQKGFKPQTIRLRITALERLAKYCKKSIALNRPKIQRSLSVENVPSESEYNKILNYTKATDYKMYLYIRAMATTGCRISELQKFTFEGICSGTITLHGKGNKYRKIMFSKTFQDEVKKYMQETGASGHFLIGRYGPMSDSAMNQRLKLIFNKLGIDTSKAHNHAFRHFFAKMYLRKTKDIVQLSDILGHDSVDTTRIYLRKTSNEQEREFNKCVTW